MMRRALLCGMVLSALASQQALADQTVTTGNAGTITATARLRFDIVIAKYVLLRVGNADATQSDVTFTVAASPAIAGAPGNSLGYTGGAIPPGFATTVATANPTTAAGALQVTAATNVTGTTLSCAMTALGGATAFATGATAGGIPGRSDIKVASVAGGLQHPGADLNSCTGAITTAIPNLTAVPITTFTYSTTFTPSALSSGTYGNVVTYTATTL
jgi:hypothetical protein